MAFTVVVLEKTVFGNQRVHHLKITADGAEDNITTGLKVVRNAIVAPGSLTTAIYNVYPNEDSSGTSSNGTLGISGIANGDVLFATVFGV